MELTCFGNKPFDLSEARKRYNATMHVVIINNRKLYDMSNGALAVHLDWHVKTVSATQRNALQPRNSRPNYQRTRKLVIRAGHILYLLSGDDQRVHGLAWTSIYSSYSPSRTSGISRLTGYRRKLFLCFFSEKTYTKVLTTVVLVIMLNVVTELIIFISPHNGSMYTIRLTKKTK